MRPPYGSYNDVVREIAASLGQNLVVWDFDLAGATAEEIKHAYADVISQSLGNALTLNHETYNLTAYGVIPHAIDQFLEKGYKLVLANDRTARKSPRRLRRMCIV
ncbi:hypothetical protein ACEPAF_5702 [Sanghuangporus sanghuang]|uniref:Chitin deacetylase n=1 Tax=Sanghuangporus baumii TaxID=108892 RepID=A0A9Q5I4S1_SANBA|nr:hypothetical protein A7U60_g1072 [Sanghuangporus baumii]